MPAIVPHAVAAVKGYVPAAKFTSTPPTGRGVGSAVSIATAFAQLAKAEALVVPSPVVSLPCGATKMTRGEIELPEQESAARRRRTKFITRATPSVRSALYSQQTQQSVMAGEIGFG